jgi:hypothetical protein
MATPNAKPTYTYDLSFEDRDVSTVEKVQLGCDAAKLNQLIKAELDASPRGGDPHIDFHFSIRSGTNSVRMLLLSASRECPPEIASRVNGWWDGHRRVPDFNFAPYIDYFLATSSSTWELFLLQGEYGYNVTSFKVDKNASVNSLIKRIEDHEQLVDIELYHKETRIANSTLPIYTALFDGAKITFKGGRKSTCHCCGQRLNGHNFKYTF